MAEAASLAAARTPRRPSSTRTRSRSRTSRSRRRFPIARSCWAAAAARTSAPSRGWRRATDRLAVVWFDAHGDLNTPETLPERKPLGHAAADAARLRHGSSGRRRARRRAEPRPARGRVHRRQRPAHGRGRRRARRSRAPTPSTSPSTSTCSTPTTRSSRFMPEPGGLTRRGGVRLLRRIVAERPSPGSASRASAAAPENAPAPAAAAVGLAARSGCRTGKPVRWPAMESRVDVTVENREAAPDGRREAAPQHLSSLPLALSRRRARGRRSGSARSAPTIFPCGRASGSRSSPIGARSPRRTPRSARPTRSSFFDLRAYTDRLAEAEVATGLGDAIIAGAAAIERRPCELAVMDFAFMGGSMGSTVGEKFARACERAAARQVPLVCVTASGGARMQEGILSLMQLPKTVCAVDELREARCAFISVMTHPTTAGVLASFASLGDVIVSEPGALLAFTGPARRPADDPREASGRLRPRRVERQLRPRRRHRPATGAAAVRRAALLAMFVRRSDVVSETPVEPGRAAEAQGAAGEAPRPSAPARRRRLGRDGAAQAPARPHGRRAERGRGLALRRARAPPGPPVHARLHRAHVRRLRRAARRPRLRGRPGDRRRPRRASTAARSCSSAIRRAGTSASARTGTSA